MVVMSNEKEFTQAQVDYLSSLHFINNIDSHLKTVSSIKIVDTENSLPTRVIMCLEIFYDNNKVDTLSFDLHNYAYDDIVEIAKNIRSNEFILQEIDNFLAGDIE